jgi:hypothetical protein
MLSTNRPAPVQPFRNFQNLNLYFRKMIERGDVHFPIHGLLQPARIFSQKIVFKQFDNIAVKKFGKGNFYYTFDNHLFKFLPRTTILN